VKVIRYEHSHGNTRICFTSLWSSIIEVSLWGISLRQRYAEKRFCLSSKQRGSTAGIEDRHRSEGASLWTLQ
jgi:hypothetical protein